MEEQTIQFRGLTNELLHCSDDGTIKSTEIYNLGNSEILSVTITSVNANGEHPLFDKLLNNMVNVVVKPNN